ncbi:phosphoribulokinase [Salinisphaera sp. USBA-960]|uniref:phosphoribulokinase n=1 Tax=Salinisphaera orenii TaxID=856731 RepID=UPI000DBE4FB1|nr:phosphoribulokinase [Salifodinibacter halophilus]NNC26923.1 phosphoribulokinase [Salifodinibacter halophilus]
MSVKHPIIAVTGSSGSGTSTARVAFDHIIRRQRLHAAFIDGDGFHRYERQAMHAAEAEADARGEAFSHFSPGANRLDQLEKLFAEYGAHGTGEARQYLHDSNEAAAFNQQPGTFTPWQPVPSGTDLLMYEGLHGGAVTQDHDIAQHVDLLVGVTPTINIEWIQKIHRDMHNRGYAPERSTDVILRRMPDYVETITPQFARSDINFQRVPLVDTSDPFIAKDVPTPDESMIVIRFREPARFAVDFPYLLTMIQGAFMSRPNTLVVPGTKMRMAIEITIGPIIERLTATA